ncbi:MAG: hypothetical protein AAF567_17810 [Actinomycetota bacterium]
MLTIDNPDFTGNIVIERLGGAEGAYRVSEGESSIVLKIADAADKTALAYNLAKDFNIPVPSARWMSLDSPAGAALKAKASGELKSALDGASAVILHAFVDGVTIGDAKDESGFDWGVLGTTANRELIGRLLVFDAAVLNFDRFKLETQTPTNSGNLMIAGGGNDLVAIDQDFAKAGSEDVLHDFGAHFAAKLQEILKNPQQAAERLVKKLAGEGYALISEEGTADVAAGIEAGLLVLRDLSDEHNLRLDTLVEWSKSFVAETEQQSETASSEREQDHLEVAAIRDYWQRLLRPD